MFNKFICYLLDHKWEKTDSLVLSTGPRGQGTLVREECKRCKEQRINFHADVNFGPGRKRSKVSNSPSVCRNICEANDENNNENNDKLNEEKKRKSNRTKTTPKTVQESSESNPS